MLNFLAIALFQAASIVSVTNQEHSVAQAPMTVNYVVALDGGSGGWAGDLAALDGGSGGWAGDLAA